MGETHADSACPQILSTTNPTLPVGANILPISFGTSPYPNPPVNQPLVSVTICTPGTTICQTVDNLLLDTGSYGLRIFRSLVAISLPAVNDPEHVGGDSVQAECVGYLTGSQWGPIVKADVLMGGGLASGVNMQEIDPDYPAGIPANSDCAGGSAIGPFHSRYNGVVGVGFLANDCGSACKNPQNTNYFKCTDQSTCVSTSVTPEYQTQNPVSKMPADFNNGVAITLPPIGSCGRSQLSGYLALGVGTRSNNTPPVSAAILNADPDTLTMLTTFEGQSMRGFIDSGSNTYHFPAPPNGADELPDCGPLSSAPGFYCPTENLNYSATMQSFGGGLPLTISFEIGNAVSLIQSGNTAFFTLGSIGGPDRDFDWGIDFFFGRTVYLVMKNQSASGLGIGPLWSF